MAAKESITNSRILTETALVNLQISRSIIGGGPMVPGAAPVPPRDAFGLNLSYADTEYLVDASGARERVLTQGQNQRWLNLAPDQVEALRDSPMKAADGAATTWGVFTDQLLDALIVADLAKVVPAP